MLFQEYEETCLFTKHESLQGDSPRVYPNILKCSLHSLVTKGIRLVGFATRAMVCETPTHYLILNSLAFARGRVILRSHFLILILLIILISRIRRNLFIHKARIPARRFSSSTSQHFKMFPPFASNEGYSASGLRYQSDGE